LSHLLSGIEREYLSEERRKRKEVEKRKTEK
jgi:hypothetical protein